MITPTLQLNNHLDLFRLIKSIQLKVFKFNFYNRTPFRWKQCLSFQEVVEIQKSCTRALKLWGYNVANKGAEYKSLNPLRNFTLYGNDNNSSL